MIGVFGGTGFYSLLDDAERKNVNTPYGEPSSPVMVGKIQGKDVAFIARHGERHEFPPHRIPYKANIFALKDLGVTRIIAPVRYHSRVLKRDAGPASQAV